MKKLVAGLGVALLPAVATAQALGPVVDNETGNTVFFAVQSTRTYWQGPITFENNVVVNSLSVGPQEGCAPGPNGTTATYYGYLFFGSSPLDVNSAAPCINVDSSSAITLSNGINVVAGSAVATVRYVAFSGIDQAGNPFNGHFELIETTHYGCSGGRGGGCHTTAYLWPSAPEYNSDGTPLLDAHGVQVVYQTKVVFDNYTPIVAPPPPPPPPPPPDVLSNPKLKITFVHVGQPVAGVIATFSDSNPNPDASFYTALIDWGDGTQAAGVVSSKAGTPSGTLSVSAPPGGHTYTFHGAARVSVTITEVAPGTASAMATAWVGLF